MLNSDELKMMATQVRRDILRMTNAAKSGHPGGSLGCADLLTALYFNILRHNPSAFTIDGKNEDLFFLSNGHISPVWYSVLARSGYFPIKELNDFRRINTRMQGHPTPAEHLPGVRIASGSLGQGLSASIGAALSKKLNGDKNFVFCLMGDGEIQEGQVWEAAMFAAAKKVDNLIAIIDNNGKQIDGPCESVISLGDLDGKWKTFGWDVLHMQGNNMDDILKVMPDAINHCGKGKPVMILMQTEMGAGVDFMRNDHKWHGVAPNDEQLGTALAQLLETQGDF
jgi:transketolase